MGMAYLVFSDWKENSKQEQLPEVLYKKDVLKILQYSQEITY